MSDRLVAGVDFGSDSARAIVVNTRTGEVLGEGQCFYSRWMDGKYCDPDKSQYRQHPLDYIEALETCVKDAINEAGSDIGKHIKGIAVDTTGSTPCPVNREGVPLALLEGFKENPNAMFHLWKDHTAVKEAEEINRVLSDWKGEDYTRFQGIYSSEWFWAKILHTTRIDSRVKKEAWSWVEHCEWLPALLTGITDPQKAYRSACAAGHKALWHSEFGGLPDPECLSALDPYLGELGKRYGGPPKTADCCVGIILPEWAERLGISPRAVVGGSTFDAHSGAIGAGISPNTLVKVVGTSTVDMMIENYDRLKGKQIKEICGQAENSIIPGYIGIEAGQAAFGDVYAWFKKIMMWPVKNILASSALLSEELKMKLIQELSSRIIPEIENCQDICEEDMDLIALDWFNGRRYPGINEHVKSAVVGLRLGTEAPQVYRTLVLATAFGSKRILEGFLSAGLTIDRIIAVGGIARKSPFVMQLLADVLERPIMVSDSKQACAKGAAMYAAVAAGIFGTLQEAQDSMCDGFMSVHNPIKENVRKYGMLYKKYIELGTFMEQQTALKV